MVKENALFAFFVYVPDALLALVIVGGIPFTVNVNCCDPEPEEFDAVTVNVIVPVVAGVPVSRPDVLNENGAGRSDELKVVGPVPEA